MAGHVRWPSGSTGWVCRVDQPSRLADWVVEWMVECVGRVGEPSRLAEWAGREGWPSGSARGQPRAMATGLEDWLRGLALAIGFGSGAQTLGLGDRGWGVALLAGLGDRLWGLALLAGVGDWLWGVALATDFLGLSQRLAFAAALALTHGLCARQGIPILSNSPIKSRLSMRCLSGLHCLWDMSPFSRSRPREARSSPAILTSPTRALSSLQWTEQSCPGKGRPDSPSPLRPSSPAARASLQQSP